MTMKFCPRCAAPMTRLPLAGRDRVCCPDHQCGYVFWDNPLPVVAALIEREGGVLLARNHGWPADMFGLITGFIERGESPEQALLREVKEELSLDVDRYELIGVYPFPRKNELIIAYHATAIGDVALNEELAEYKLVPPAELRPWAHGTGLAMRDWLARRTLSNGT